MSGEVNVPPQIQEQFTRLQQLQQTYQVVATQKQQLELELSEAEKALEELTKADDTTPVYKSSGNILLKVERSKLITELTEKKELFTTRISVLSKQEERTRNKVNELQTKLQDRLRNMPR